jgi:hypothetical protein
MESLYLTAIPVREQPGISGARNTAPYAAATIINGMRSRRIGRALGIGLRVAGRVAGQRLAAQSQAGSVQPAQPADAPDSASHTGGAATQSRAQQWPSGQPASPAGRGLKQGVGSFLRPFRRVGGILWLEVTGVFFLLPVIVFAPNLWREAVAYSHTTDHRTFWITLLIVVVFLYLGVSSFWRARRR